MIEKIYLNEFKEILKPIQLGQKIYGFVFEDIVFLKFGPFFINEVIFKFSYYKDDYFLRLRIESNCLKLDYKNDRKESNLAKIKTMIETILKRNENVVINSLLYSAMQKDEYTFLNKIKSVDLINFSESNKINYVNYQQRISDKKFQLLDSFSYLVKDGYNILVENICCYDYFGLGDFLIFPRFSQNRVFKKNYVITDFFSLYNETNCDAIYADLAECFKDNKLTDKKVVIVDYFLFSVYGKKELDKTYLFFKYIQYCKLYYYITNEDIFDKFKNDPNKGIKFIINHLLVHGIKILNYKELHTIKAEFNPVYIKENSLISDGNNRPNKKIIGISANYNESHEKGWQTEYWCELINKLKESYDIEIVLLPVNNNILFTDDNVNKDIINSLKNNIKVTSYDNYIFDEIVRRRLYKDHLFLKTYTLEFLKQAINKCDFVLAIDSGPAHLAASLQIPVLSMFSIGGNVKKYKPFGSSSYALYKNNDANDNEYLPIKEITPNYVFKYLKQILLKYGF